MKGFPSKKTTNSVRLILGSQYSLCENYIKRARLLRGLKQVLGTNLIPLRTKFDTHTKRVPAWPLISGTSFAKARAKLQVNFDPGHWLFLWCENRICAGLQTVWPYIRELEEDESVRETSRGVYLPVGCIFPSYRYLMIFRLKREKIMHGCG